MVTDTETDPDQNPDLPEHGVALAAAVRRLGNSLVSRSLDPARAVELTALVEQITEELNQTPAVSKLESLGRRNRITTFIEKGEWPPAPPDGARLEFDPASVVGGELNPFSMGALYYRDGDEVVGHLHLGKCFEGPPERVHGGVICAIFDEVMGSVFRATGTASAFTGELAVRFVAPAPLETDLVFRGRQDDAVGRRRLMSGEATAPDGTVFATATATFIEMTPEQIFPPSRS